MTNNWIEEFNKEFLDKDTGLLTIGKYDYEEVVGFIDSKIYTLLEKQREEYVEMIENKRKLNDCIVSSKYKRAVPYTCPEAIMICEDIIGSIKSHDKTL